MSNQTNLQVSSEMTGSFAIQTNVILSRKANFRRYKKYRELAILNQNRGKLYRAQKCLEKAIEIAIKIGGRNHSSVLLDLELLGNILKKQGKTDVSIAILMRTKRARLELYTP